MSVLTKRCLSLALALCLCFSLLALTPATAYAADTEIKNATTTVDYIDPVVLLEVSKNVVRATGTGYKLISASWIGSDGKAETNAFKSGSYRLVVKLEADKGYVFAADAKGYVNNSNTGVTTERSEDGKTLTLSRSCNTTIWTPVPVKHPGPETVKEGDWCSFVVSGLYVGSYEWIFETPEGGTVPAARLKDRFPDVRLEGDGTSKIKIFNIPYGMNGWKVYCTEWSADKLSFVNTNSTTLTVTSDAPQPTAAPEPSPAPEAQEQTQPADGTQEQTQEAVPVQGEAPEHEHKFSEGWTYDQQTHWHACEGCDTLDAQAPHSIVWTVTREATAEEGGEEQGQCSVCGYRGVRETPIDEQAASAAEQNIFRAILFGLLAVLLLSILILVIQAIRRATYRR